MNFLKLKTKKVITNQVFWTVLQKLRNSSIKFLSTEEVFHSYDIAKSTDAYFFHQIIENKCKILQTKK